MSYDGQRELRSRLPDVPDTVIALFLSKYNVEECYEKLKNGYDDSDMSDFDSTSVYNPQLFEGTAGRATNVAQPFPVGPQGQEMPQSYFQASTSGVGGGGGGWTSPPPQPTPPYPVYDSDTMPRSPAAERRSVSTDPDTELIAEQRQQLEYIKKIKDWCTYDLNALRSDAENKRHTLTALRIEVSEGPTILDTASLQDIITTLQYDIQTLQNKIQVEKMQAMMKEKQDMYTEEGVRWSCQSCDFLNHPLMSRCESCDKMKS